METTTSNSLRTREENQLQHSTLSAVEAVATNATKLANLMQNYSFQEDQSKSMIFTPAKKRGRTEEYEHGVDSPSHHMKKKHNDDQQAGPSGITTQASPVSKSAYDTQQAGPSGLSNMDQSRNDHEEELATAMQMQGAEIFNSTRVHDNSTSTTDILDQDMNLSILEDHSSFVSTATAEEQMQLEEEITKLVANIENILASLNTAVKVFEIGKAKLNIDSKIRRIKDNLESSPNSISDRYRNLLETRIEIERYFNEIASYQLSYRFIVKIHPQYDDPQITVENNRIKFNKNDRVSEYTLDHIVKTEVNANNELFEQVCPFLLNFYTGNDSAIVLIGGSGTGKSYSMFGNSSKKGAEGILELILRNVLLTVESEKDKPLILIEACEFLNINEDIFNKHITKDRKISDKDRKDTLRRDKQLVTPHRRDSPIRNECENERMTVQIADKSQAEAAVKIISDYRRTFSTAETEANKGSSRRHLQIRIYMVKKDHSCFIELYDLCGKEDQVGSINALETYKINNDYNTVIEMLTAKFMNDKISRIKGGLIKEHMNHLLTSDIKILIIGHLVRKPWQIKQCHHSYQP